MELKIPPVLVLMVAALLMWLSAKLLPDTLLPRLPLLALLLFSAGAGVIAAGISAFRRVGTTVNPLEPGQSSGVVSDGIYRFSRNPMYLGMVLMLAGWALWLGQAAAWPGVAGFAAYIHRFQILPEERILSAKFGAAYQAYCRNTRRWL
ncbi:isoprenylcysteine carboxylmethyltransferase family protein [Neisseria dentiae]|uniref:methyltransferase family protein n=1 Tax=Neisseria dentiae TaxID=194197 RepID=UPI0035A0B7F0